MAHALRELTYLAGGEAAARIARAFGLLVSPDALLRHLRQTAVPTASAPRVLGIDDFAFRRGRRYGTVLVDLEKRCPVDLLPNREPETVAAWLWEHPGIEVISRDRGACYVEGATKGAPDAVQVADRWHLVKNLGDALERFLVRNHAVVRTLARTLSTESVLEKEVNGAFPALTDPPPAPLTQAQQQEKCDRRGRRLARFEEVRLLHGQGLSQREIAQRTGMARKTVRKFARPEGFPEIQTRPKRGSKLAAFAGHLRKRWQEGCYDATRLHEEITAQGFTGSVDVVQRHVALWREVPRSRQSGRHPPPVVPAPRHLAWVLTNPAHPKVSGEERAFVSRLTAQFPAFGEAGILAQTFGRLVRERDAGGLDGWLSEVESSSVAELKGFARGLMQDKKAVEAGLSLEWSNGQVEGQVNRLKFLKRAMYGRASFELLKARVLPLPKTV